MLKLKNAVNSFVLTKKKFNRKPKKTRRKKLKRRLKGGAALTPLEQSILDANEKLRSATQELERIKTNMKSANQSQSDAAKAQFADAEAKFAGAKTLVDRLEKQQRNAGGGSDGGGGSGGGGEGGSGGGRDGGGSGIGSGGSNPESPTDKLVRLIKEDVGKEKAKIVDINTGDLKEKVENNRGNPTTIQEGKVIAKTLLKSIKPSIYHIDIGLEALKFLKISDLASLLNIKDAVQKKETEIDELVKKLFSTVGKLDSNKYNEFLSTTNSEIISAEKATESDIMKIIKEMKEFKPTDLETYFPTNTSKESSKPGFFGSMFTSSSSKSSAPVSKPGIFGSMFKQTSAPASAKIKPSTYNVITEPCKDENGPGCVARAKIMTGGSRKNKRSKTLKGGRRRR